MSLVLYSVQNDRKYSQINVKSLGFEYYAVVSVRLAVLIGLILRVV